MTKRNDYRAGVPCFVDTGRVDSATARDFYGGLLGWDFENVSPGGDAPPYHMAKLGGLTVAGIGTQPEQDWDPVWNTYVSVPDADATATAVADAGGQVLMAPFDIGPAGRMAVFADPQGAEFCVWQAGQTAGAEVVNDVGAVVFNTLHTTDLPAAVEFYGTVFGWAMEAEGEQSWMIRLPGYHEDQDELVPGFSKGMEEMGAPEGFADVVAAVVTDGPARWEVTFAVQSADHSAARVRELGGTVVSEPQDLPWVRETTVRDPDGAQFVLSQFVPPES
ncbi:MAG TPA: VOC family protein [Thermoleophilaceae bacterium]|nr:VOC family protein [Thermoleophilaceae bacterium]